MSTINQSKIDIMYSELRSRRVYWSPQGIRFLCYRSNGRGGDDELFSDLFKKYLSGGFDDIDSTPVREARLQFGLDRIGPEAILIILLGRPPHWSHKGIQEKSKSLSDNEVKAQKILANTLAESRRYTNKRRGARSNKNRETSP